MCGRGTRFGPSNGRTAIQEPLHEREPDPTSDISFRSQGMRSRKHVVDRLRGQMRRGQAILFTGAGFSTEARNRQGELLPGTVALRDALHNVAFPTVPVDHTTTLGDAFSVALRRNAGATRGLLENRLSVDPASLPEYYRLYYTQPWRRVYTLNFDDLEMAAAARFSLSRRLASVSATTDRADEPPANMPGEQLEVIHLNGCISDDLSNLLFNEPQYARQVATPNRWFVRCAEELRSRPVIYVGTELRESTLWTYIELRTMRRESVDVLPPGSILVTPNLPAARAELLRDYNVDWLDLDAAEFAVEILGELARTIHGDRDLAPGRRNRNRTRSRTTGNEQWGGRWNVSTACGRVVERRMDVMTGAAGEDSAHFPRCGRLAASVS